MIPLILFLFAAGGADPAGWSKARWGMSESQILEAFEGQAVRPETASPSCTFVDGEKRYSSPVIVPSVEIDGTPFRACFRFDGGKLWRVDLQPLAPADATALTFQRLEALLAEKYGKPFFQRGQMDDRSQWTFPTTTISLTLTTVRAVRLQFLHLVYQRRKPQDNL